MRLIHKGNFFSVFCMIFTIGTMFKIIAELIVIGDFGIYAWNLVAILLVSLLSTFILYQHHRIFHLPLVLAAFIQYLFVILPMLFFIWFTGLFTELAKTAYRDMFVSVTIMYILISAVYYIFFYLDTKRHNHILQKLKQSRKKNI